MTKHNHITRDIKPLGECPSCDEYHDKHIPKKYLEYPAVIDWLQWGDFPEKMGDINYPQVALTMIAEMRTDLKNYQLEIHELKTKYDFQHLVKENEKLKEAISYLPKVPTQPYEKQLAHDNLKLREQVKDYEGALKEYEDMNDYYGRPELAREVLKKWGEL